MSLKKNFFSINEKKIKHGFFTRLNGVSKRQFESLNCSFSCGDKKKLVYKNREISLKYLKLNKKKLILLNQTHSTKVIRIDQNNQNNKLTGDGLITSLNHVVLGILTADCAPIFIYDDKKKFICCLHSGWKGTLKNIAKNAIKHFDKLKIERQSLIAIIGPCLGVRNYEVDKTFEVRFLKQNRKYANFFKNKNKSKSYFDLRGLINYQLSILGIKRIYNIKRDTYSNDSLFFSHRRSSHQSQKSTGRLINLISFS